MRFGRTSLGWRPVGSPKGLSFFPTVLNPGPRQELEKGLAEAEIPVEAVMASGQLVIDERQDEPKKMQDALGNALAEVPGRSCCLLRREAAAEPESGSTASWG